MLFARSQVQKESDSNREDVDKQVAYQLNENRCVDGLVEANAKEKVYNADTGHSSVGADEDSEVALHLLDLALVAVTANETLRQEMVQMDESKARKRVESRLDECLSQVHPVNGIFQVLAP